MKMKRPHSNWVWIAFTAGLATGLASIIFADVKANQEKKAARRATRKQQMNTIQPDKKITREEARLKVRAKLDDIRSKAEFCREQ